MNETSVKPGKVSWQEHGHHMDEIVQEALDDPRPGDIFHEMYSYGVQVLDVDGDGVHWRSFNTGEVGRGIETREAWSQSFRYGDHMPGKHTMNLLERGATPAPPADTEPATGSA